MLTLGIWLLGYVGRRKMLIIGFAGVAGSQALLAVVFMLPQSDAVSYTILAAMMLSFLFPIVNGTLGSTGTFALFVVINLISLGFVSRFVPETKGRSLEELEADFRRDSEVNVPVAI